MKAGLETVPALIYAVSRDEAAIMLVDSNLHREHILPSEKAFAYKLKMDALKHQGKTSSQPGTKLRTDEIIAEQTGESRNQIQRYIRLTNLIPELLELVDEGKIALTPAVELSYLTEIEQRWLHEAMEYTDATPSLSQSIKLKAFSQDKTLGPHVIESLLSEEKPNQREKFSFRAERLRRYIPDSVPFNQTEDFVCKALEHYSKFLKNKNRNPR